MPRQKISSYCMPLIDKLEERLEANRKEHDALIRELRNALLYGRGRAAKPRKKREVKAVDKIQKIIDIVPEFVEHTGDAYHVIPAQDIRFVLRKFYDLNVSNIQLAAAMKQAYGVTSRRQRYSSHFQNAVLVCYPCLKHPAIGDLNAPEGSDSHRYKTYQDAIADAGLWGTYESF